MESQSCKRLAEQEIGSEVTAGASTSLQIFCQLKKQITSETLCKVGQPKCPRPRTSSACAAQAGETWFAESGKD